MVETIRVNGEKTVLRSRLTIGGLVENMELDERYLVVEHNGLPLRFADARDVELHDGDKIELVRPVAGG